MSLIEVVPMSAPEEMLRAMVGTEVPGGCSCPGAYQTTEEVEPGIFRMTIHHDEGCPHFRAIVGKRRAN